MDKPIPTDPAMESNRLARTIAAADDLDNPVIQGLVEEVERLRREVHKRTVSDPQGIRHKLDWNHADWLNRTVCGKKSNLATGWIGVPTEWTEDCPECWRVA